MFHLDNSETSWLVYADWLEDQDIDAAHVRELNPTSNGWCWEYRPFFDKVGSGYGDSEFSQVGNAGCQMYYEDMVGNHNGNSVGSIDGNLVGNANFYQGIGCGSVNHWNENVSS